jgi:hypothetical protein
MNKAAAAVVVPFESEQVGAAAGVTPSVPEPVAGAVVIPIDRARRARRAHLDWSEADDQALVRGVTAGDADAWHEFMRRHMPTIEKRVKRYISRCWRRFRSNDTFDDIKAEVFVALMTNNMGRLRSFDGQKGTLAGWVSMISQQVAYTHLNKLTRRPLPEPMEDLIERADRRGADQRGARWVAEGL